MSCPVPPNNPKIFGEFLLFVLGYSHCVQQMFAVVFMYMIPKFLTRSQGLIGCHSELGMRRAEPNILTSLKVIIPTSDRARVNRKMKSLIRGGEFLFRELAVGNINTNPDVTCK